MCGHCVIDNVKRRMLSRRTLLTGAAAAGLAAATVPLAPTPAAAQTSGGTLADLTHELSRDFPTFAGQPGFAADQLFHFAADGFNLFSLTINEHTGTHIDAPLHFSADGQAVNEIPVANLMAPLVKIDIAQRAAENPDAQVTPDDLTAWIEANGDLPEGCCVAMYSGWERRIGNGNFRNADSADVMHFPGFHIEAAQMLLETASVVGMAVDTLSLDHGPSQDFAVHYAWLPTNRWGLENVANLADVPAAGATIIVGAPKHRGGSGGPTRVFALV